MWFNFRSKLVNKIFSYFICFIKMSLSFRNEWRMIELKETKEEVEFKIIIATKIHKNLKKSYLWTGKAILYCESIWGINYDWTRYNGPRLVERGWKSHFRTNSIATSKSLGHKILVVSKVRHASFLRVLMCIKRRLKNWWRKCWTMD